MSGIEENKEAVRREIESLTYEFKVELPKKIAEARAYGDLKENAEYHAARERQSFVKARIAQLNEQLNNLKSMDISSVPRGVAGFGSKIRVKDLDSGDCLEFTLVASNEVNPTEGKVSLSSPIGKGFQNRKAGDEVEIVIPAGKKLYYIEKIITIHGEEIELKKTQA